MYRGGEPCGIPRTVFANSHDLPYFLMYNADNVDSPAKSEPFLAQIIPWTFFSDSGLILTAGYFLAEGRQLNDGRKLWSVTLCTGQPISVVQFSHSGSLQQIELYG